MKKAFLIIGSLALLSFHSCDKTPTTPEKEEEATPGTQTEIPVSGAYSWAFSIPGMGDQVSTLVFHQDSVNYLMEGAAYTTSYNMVLESYTESGDESRWIGVGQGGSIPKDGVYFVMFIKDITEHSVTVYKHECDRGWEEAESFAYPAPDATADHGWNVYIKK